MDGEMLAAAQVLGQRVILWVGGLIEVKTEQHPGLRPSQRLDSDVSYLPATQLAAFLCVILQC